MSPPLVRSFAPVLAIVVAISGCASSLRTIDSARNEFAVGNLASARDTLHELANSNGRFAEAASLDLAMVELAAGDHAAAERRLRESRDRFDSLPTVAPVREAASMVTDDTTRLFRPAGYEQVMVRAMLAICSLAGDASDAESYAMQAAMKQSEFAADAESRGVDQAADHYQPIAIAPYLQGMLREATHHDYDDAAKAYQLVSAVRPDFAPAADDIARAVGGAHSAAGHGVLYVIGCVGRGPVLRETTAPTTSTALSIASATLNAETNKGDDGRVNGPVIPNIASVKVPELILPRCDVAAVSARIDGRLYGATQVLTDVSELAAKQLAAEMPWMIARAVVRRATKEATVAKVGDSLGLSGVAGSFFHFGAATLWSSSESADLRCWGLLPREIQVLRAELPRGTHDVQLAPLDFAGLQIGPGQSREIDIVDGRNHYLIVIAPGQAFYVVGS